MKKTHHSQLLNLHKNGDWICSTMIEWMRDHRKRYSELAAKGYVFQAQPCDGRCGTQHSSRLFMRCLTDRPMKTVTKVVERDGKYYPTQVQVPA